ncbi:MAG: pyruvate formate lyase-activating protein [Fibrobacter sp.]|jgi:pyruvate formate lyase activating enzyme|nr:pyruvate formate lyase-activating protein [Fibrobacter sp.]
MQSGFVHSFESGAAADGPGVRFALFLTGCSFRCVYCHNPDTWELSRGKKMTSDEVLGEIGKYARFLRIAGGLTVTGGDPLCQADFTHEILERSQKELGLHTALDTQGFLADKLPDSWFDAVDLVLLDIKQIHPEKHLALTGKNAEPTLRFAERLECMGKKFWLRYVLVPGITDDETDLKNLAAFIKPFTCMERVEVLPFHQLGKHKWEEMNLPYSLANTRVPTREEVCLAESILRGG